jgi:hypothetical protein
LKHVCFYERMLDFVSQRFIFFFGGSKIPQTIYFGVLG